MFSITSMTSQFITPPSEHDATGCRATAPMPTWLETRTSRSRPTLHDSTLGAYDQRHDGVNGEESASRLGLRPCNSGVTFVRGISAYRPFSGHTVHFSHCIAGGIFTIVGLSSRGQPPIPSQESGEASPPQAKARDYGGPRILIAV